MKDLISTLAARNKAPVPLVSRSAAVGGGRHYAAPRGQQAQLRAYGSNGTLFGIVDRTSTATAAVSWHLYRKAKSGQKEDRVEVTQHAALDLWNRPNEFFTQRLFLETEQQHLDLTGEGWIVVARHKRMKNLPLELWPVPPHRMRPVVSPTDYLIGYIYTSPDGEDIPLAKDDVIQMRRPDPDNPYRGLGPVQALMRTLDASRYSEEWNRNFFVNGAEPGGIIEVETTLGDEEFNQARDRWAESHQGVANAHRVAILEGGMKWVDRRYTMRDMQFVELAKVGDDKLFIAYGVSKSMLGVTEDVNRANAEAGKVMFAEYLTIPRLDRFRDMLNFQLLPLYGPTGEGLEWDYDDPVPPDAEARDRERTSKATAFATYVQAGVDGESLVKPLGLPEGMVWSKPEPAAPPPAPSAADGDGGGQQKAVPKPQSLLASLSWLNAAAEPAPVGEEMEQVRQDWEAALAALLAAWAGITAAQRADLLAQITAAVTAGNAAALASLSVPSEQGAAVLAEALAAMAATAAAQAAAEAAAQGVAVTAPGVAGGDLVLVAAAVAGLLAAGLAAAAGKEALRLFVPGADGAEVAGQVDAHLAALSDRYLRDQLGGALTRAQNVGRLETFKAAEAVNPQVEYYADEVNDVNTCKPCEEIDGTVFDAWIDAWEAYAGGSYRKCLGGVRCRGTVRARWIGGA